LSKLARTVIILPVGFRSRSDSTTQIANYLQQKLKPKGVASFLEADHLCMSLRGVHKRGAKTVTSALLGAMRNDARARQEFLAHVGAGETR